MTKCKWAGDPNDEYCKGCDGIKMTVDDVSVSCEQCAGYEAGTEEITEESTPNEVVEESANVDTAETQQNVEKQPETKKTVNTKGKKEKPENDANKHATECTKVKEEKKASEQTEEIDGAVKVVSLRYMSGATIQRGDNYFKFTAEEEWDVSQVKDVDTVREQFWAKLNMEIDSQIEELQNIQ